MKLLETVKMMKQGFFICLCEEHSSDYTHRDLYLTDGEDYYECHWKVFEALKKKGLVKEHLEHTTIQPDTWVYHYMLVKHKADWLIC